MPQKTKHDPRLSSEIERSVPKSHVVTSYRSQVHISHLIALLGQCGTNFGSFDSKVGSREFGQKTYADIYREVLSYNHNFPTSWSPVAPGARSGVTYRLRRIDSRLLVSQLYGHDFE